VEKDREGLVDGDGVDRGRARTNLFLERKALPKELSLLQEQNPFGEIPSALARTQVVPILQFTAKFPFF
jgi:hypothetical protein